MCLEDGARDTKAHGSSDGEAPLYDFVEIDETYVGDKTENGHMCSDNKAIVLGLKQRNGQLITKIVPNTKRETLLPIIRKYVDKDASIIFTDEHGTYSVLRKAGYKHKTVNHKQGEYVRGNVHTNTIENAWSGLKRSIKGTHIHVSKKHIGKYAKEFEYRSNSVGSKMNSNDMFDELITTYHKIA